MDAAALLANMIALSSDIERAAVVDAQGAVVAATSPDDGETLARAAAELFDSAPTRHARVAQVEVGLAAGSLFAVRDGERVAVATTSAEPPAALVLHDLRALLRAAAHA